MKQLGELFQTKKCTSESEWWPIRTDRPQSCSPKFLSIFQPGHFQKIYLSQVIWHQCCRKPISRLLRSVYFFWKYSGYSPTRNGEAINFLQSKTAHLQWDYTFNYFFAEFIFFIPSKIDGYQRPKCWKVANGKCYFTLLPNVILQKKSMERPKYKESLEKNDPFDVIFNDLRPWWNDLGKSENSPKHDSNKKMFSSEPGCNKYR